MFSGGKLSIHCLSLLLLTGPCIPEVVAPVRRQVQAGGHARTGGMDFLPPAVRAPAGTIILGCGCWPMCSAAFLSCRALFLFHFIYQVLNNFIIPFFSFSSYINFLLIITKFSVFQMGYDSTINGPYLIGDGGTLFMAKWCLGFLTMFVFASLIYLTRGETKAKWLFIFWGLVFLHIVNIVRLAVLFIFVQNNDSQLAQNHHNIYNIVFYTIIFILWIIWFEKFALKKNKEKSV